MNMKLIVKILALIGLVMTVGMASATTVHPTKNLHYGERYTVDVAKNGDTVTMQVWASPSNAISGYTIGDVTVLGIPCKEAYVKASANVKGYGGINILRNGVFTDQYPFTVGWV